MATQQATNFQQPKAASGKSRWQFSFRSTCKEAGSPREDDQVWEGCRAAACSPARHAHCFQGICLGARAHRHGRLQVGPRAGSPRNRHSLRHRACCFAHQDLRRSPREARKALDPGANNLHSIPNQRCACVPVPLPPRPPHPPPIGSKQDLFVSRFRTCLVQEQHNAKPPPLTPEPCTRP